MYLIAQFEGTNLALKIDPYVRAVVDGEGSYTVHLEPINIPDKDQLIQLVLFTGNDPIERHVDRTVDVPMDVRWEDSDITEIVMAKHQREVIIYEFDFEPTFVDDVFHFKFGRILDENTAMADRIARMWRRRVFAKKHVPVPVLLATLEEAFPGLVAREIARRWY